MTIRLTKKRLKALDNALTFDDLLYEKFRRLNEELHRYEHRIQRGKQIIEVIRDTGAIHEVMQIQSIQWTPNGTRVVVR